MTQHSSRRALLAGAGAAGVTVALAGCAAYGETSGGTGARNAAAPKEPSTPGGFASTSDIPVGGGRVFAEQKIVVTQPAAGVFKCFTAVCTHAGCLVGEVAGGTINCPCHGSKFKVADGSVANGPASRPLAEVAIKVAGDAISRATG